MVKITQVSQGKSTTVEVTGYNVDKVNYAARKVYERLCKQASADNYLLYFTAAIAVTTRGDHDGHTEMMAKVHQVERV